MSCDDVMWCHVMSFDVLCFLVLVYQPLESFPPSANLWLGCWLVPRYNCWLAPKGKPILTLAADDNHLIIIESIILVYVRSQALVSMAWDLVDWGSATSIGAWHESKPSQVFKAPVGSGVCLCGLGGANSNKSD